LENLTHSETLYEKMIIASLRFRKRWHFWQGKGREKISFLVVPHSEQVVLKLDMSFSMLIFLSAISIILISLSFWFLVYYSFIWKGDPAVLLDSNADRTKFLYYSLLAEDMEESIENLEKQTEELNLLAWDEVSWKKLITQDYFPEPAIPSPDYNDMETNMNLFPKTVQNYSENSVRLKKMEPVFHNAIDYLDRRETIFQNMPRGRPLAPGVGNVTSTWGYRMDPFGILPTGEFHSGIDFAAGEGTPIYATAPGIVPKLEFSTGGLGKAIRINHENGFYTIYGHSSQVLVQEGMQVKRGDKIGLVGQTGKATGSHVHYEVHIGLDPSMDPEEFINLD
jgi:murein DD-endopeptidase MepM/ murein hydrolase activator NlpD